MSSVLNADITFIKTAMIISALNEVGQYLLMMWRPSARCSFLEANMIKKHGGYLSTRAQTPKSKAPGFANLAFTVGNPGNMPIAGNWG